MFASGLIKSADLQKRSSHRIEELVLLPVSRLTTTFPCLFIKARNARSFYPMNASSFPPVATSPCPCLEKTDSPFQYFKILASDALILLLRNSQEPPISPKHHPYPTTPASSRNTECLAEIPKLVSHPDPLCSARLEQPYILESIYQILCRPAF
jgi:hypothetical protein